jgi:hypothetical protein
MGWVMMFDDGLGLGGLMRGALAVVVEKTP